MTLNIRDYQLACDVLMEQRNEVQKSIEDMLSLFKDGRLDNSSAIFQDSLHFLHDKRNDFDFANEQLNHTIKCREAVMEIEQGV